jgi:hypothetical protein
VSNNLTDRHQAALDYVAQGYRIIPCAPGQKVPLEKDWHGNALATVDQVNAYFELHGDCNIAMCPDDMGWAVIDIDPDADTSKLELPPTKTVKTPRGGWHLYYTGSVPPTVGKLGAHIDTRGQRSYVLLPPSVVNGASYVETDGRYPTLLPATIEAGVAARNDAVGARTEELDSPTDISSGRALLRSYARRGVVSISGQGGNNCAYQVAAKLVRDFGLTAATSLELMMEEWNDACVPPWPRDKLAEICVNALNYGQNAQAAFATRPAGETFAHVDLAKFASAEPQPGEDPKKPSRFRFLSGPEMHALEPPKWIIPDLIPEDGIVLVTASKGSFKTFLAMEMGLSVPLGRPTWGSQPVGSGLTFYGAHEGIRAIQKRHRDAWCQENGIDPLVDTGFYVAPAPHISLPDECSAFVDEMERVVDRTGKQPRLLILDTYSQCMMGLNENDPGDVSKFLNFCQGFLRLHPGAAVLTLAHVGKDPTRGTRGSNSLEAGVDTVIDLTRDGKTLLAKANIRFQRSAPEKSGMIRWRGKVVNDSLVFSNVHAAEWLAEKALTDPADRKHVAAVLQALNAVDKESGVVTMVLAERMTNRQEGESNENYTARIIDMKKLLEKREELDVYRDKVKGREVWSCPAPNDDPDGL